MSLTDLEMLLPVAGSDKGYAIANKATGRYGVYRYDFLTDTVGEPVFEHPRVDVEAIIRSPRTGEPDSVSSPTSANAWPGSTRICRPFRRASTGVAGTGQPDRLARRFRQSDDRPFGGGSDPGTYYVFDRSKGTLDELAKSYEALEESRSLRSSRSATPPATASPSPPI